jgi:hypothetical protein
MQMFFHPCREGNEEIIRYFGAEKVKPSWKMPRFMNCNKWPLKEFQFAGFRPQLQQHLLFVRSVMDRAQDLKSVILTSGQVSCKRCKAMVTILPPVGGVFPTNRDEQELVAKQLRDKVSSSAQIIFRSVGSTFIL